MAEFDHIRTSSPHYVREYHHTIWGELIYGTKEQLQALGIGIDAQFPTTERRRVKVKDPRGFMTNIRFSPDMGEGIYSASVHFPGRERADEGWTQYAPGVRMRDYSWFEEYTGTGEALAAAGIVQAENLPGQPGMGKVQVTLFPDGTRQTSRNGHRKQQPGHLTINRVSRSKFTVQVRLSDEEGELRREANARRNDAWERKMAALPRSAPLTPLAPGAVLAKQTERAKQDMKFQAFLGNLTK